MYLDYLANMLGPMDLSLKTCVVGAEIFSIIQIGKMMKLTDVHRLLPVCLANNVNKSRKCRCESDRGKQTGYCKKN